VASRLVLRWAAQQPQNHAPGSVRYTAFSLIGGASHPNAGQARSPQRLQFALPPTVDRAHSPIPVGSKDGRLLKRKRPANTR